MSWLGECMVGWIFWDILICLRLGESKGKKTLAKLSAQLPRERWQNSVFFYTSLFRCDKLVNLLVNSGGMGIRHFPSFLSKPKKIWHSQEGWKASPLGKSFRDKHAFLLLPTVFPNSCTHCSIAFVKCWDTLLLLPLLNDSSMTLIHNWFMPLVIFGGLY